jgi:hypothetical protein
MSAPLNTATLQAMADFPNQLEQFYAAIPESHSHWTPPSWDGIPSETFSALGQVCHVRDIEIDGYHVRLQRTLTETNPVLVSLDGYELEKERNYATADAREVLAAFRAARAQNDGDAVESHAAAAGPQGGIRGLRCPDLAQPGALPVQPRPAAPGRFAVAARQD